MLIDAFPFFNELDVLEIRLNTLNSVVDKFVLVESELTQSLQPKPLFFEENKDRFATFLPKIEHIIVRREECPDNIPNLWQMENFQRNCILRGLKDASEDDNVIVSDVDEIPNPDAITFFLGKTLQDTIAFDMSFFLYFLNLKAAHRNWKGSVASSVNIARMLTPQGLRNRKDTSLSVRNSGWHFSWLGGVDKIHAKALSCIEPYDKSQVASKEEIAAKLHKGLTEGLMSFIHPENLNQQGFELEFLRSLEILPQYLQDNKLKYQHHFFE